MDPMGVYVSLSDRVVATAGAPTPREIIPPPPFPPGTAGPRCRNAPDPKEQPVETTEGSGDLGRGGCPCCALSTPSNCWGCGGGFNRRSATERGWDHLDLTKTWIKGCQIP